MTDELLTLCALFSFFSSTLACPDASSGALEEGLSSPASSRPCLCRCRLAMGCMAILSLDDTAYSSFSSNKWRLHEKARQTEGAQHIGESRVEAPVRRAGKSYVSTSSAGFYMHADTCTFPSISLC